MSSNKDDVPTHVKVLKNVPGIPLIFKECAKKRDEHTHYRCRKLADIVTIAETPKSVILNVEYLESNKDRCINGDTLHEDFHISQLLEDKHDVITEQRAFTSHINDLCTRP